MFDAIVTVLGIAPIDKAHAAEKPPSLSTPSRRLHVLVAEDHPVNQRLVTAILKERGHSLSIANNGVEVLQMLDQQAFDVILMDCQMPEMDGYQTTAEIRRREKSTGQHIRIIAVTAHAMKQDREMCLAAGMDDYVSKPISLEHLVERLEASPIDGGAAFSAHRVEATEISVAGSVFDVDSALKRARGKQALLKQLIAMFLQDLPNDLAGIHAAVAANDASALERSVHRLKGAAFNLSAEPVADAAQKLEQRGRDGHFDQIQAVVEELEARVSELTTELQAYMGEPT